MHPRMEGKNVMGAVGGGEAVKKERRLPWRWRT
jgi:hypothetical protein